MENVKSKPFNQRILYLSLSFARSFLFTFFNFILAIAKCLMLKANWICVKVVFTIAIVVSIRIASDQTSLLTLSGFIGFCAIDENTSIIVFVYFDLSPLFESNFTQNIYSNISLEMGQMIAHQSFPFTLPISYASCNEQITSDRFNWFLFIFSHVLFHSIQISVVHNKIYFNIFNIKFNRFIHAYASFTWYQLVYVERCDISVAINCTLNRYYQTKFLFRSPNVMKRQPTSSVVHSQCYTE